MGQVIQIQNASRPQVGALYEDFIEESYRRLSELKNFTIRDGQKDLSIAVRDALLLGAPLAAEAPTGTGKTLAYLIGALAAADKLRTNKDVMVVAATATVGLQNQILTGDLPKLVSAHIVEDDSFVLAKGRGRYLCVAGAERLIEDSTAINQDDLFDQQANVDGRAVEEVADALQQWYGKAWNGDIDTFTGRVPAYWKAVQASSDSCIGHKCDHYNDCPFFVARRSLSTAKIVVANHDLILSDLAMAKAGIDPIFPSSYLVVFDEAHHLPDKAIDAGSASLEVSKLQAELPALLDYNKAWSKHPDLMKVLRKEGVLPEDFAPDELLQVLKDISTWAQGLEVEPETFQLRFPKGVLPEDLRRLLERANTLASNLVTALQEATKAIKGTNLPEKNPHLQGPVTDILMKSAAMNAMVSNLTKALALLVGAARMVRWAFVRDSEVSLHSSPLEGADVLKDLVWDNERISVAMVSATLRDTDGFERFKARAGLGEDLLTTTLEPMFPYRENSINIVSTRYSPKQEQLPEFEQELTQLLPASIRANEGTLVLFPSRALMTMLLPALRSAFPGQVLCQGDMGIRDLVKAHKSSITKGRGSILCGLATLAEGLDLPGEFCTHVVICKMPFSVPTSAVERELQEELGKQYFKLRAMPDTFIKLVQMVGRLMRRESDRGRITVFDKRLVYTNWGRKMLGALPPFRRRIIKPEAILDGSYATGSKPTTLV